jgi:hypothetical protein
MSQPLTVTSQTVGKLAELDFLLSLISHAEEPNPLLAIRLRQIATSAAPYRVPQMLPIARGEVVLSFAMVVVKMAKFLSR